MTLPSASPNDHPIPPAGYLVSASERVVRMLVTDAAAATELHRAGETVERLYTESQLSAMRALDRTRIAELEDRLEEASIAASETAPSWKHRCYRILGALGLDYGDPDWLMPGDRRRLEAALTRIAELEEKLQEREMPLGEIERLLDAEQALERHHVGHDGSFLPDVWYVRSNDTPQERGVRLSAHPTRWEALAAAEIADRHLEDCGPLRNA